MKFKAIIFDFFDVLVLHGSDSFRLTYFPDDPEKNEKVKKLQLERERGTIDFDHFVTKLAEVGRVDRAVVLKHIDNYQPNLQLLKYIHDKLKSKYKIGMLSDTGRGWPYIILGSEYLAMFDDIIGSDKAPFTESETHIFKLAARSLKVKEKECVYIGYLPSYCQTAESVGMKSIWYWGFKQIEKEFD